jgi:AI-2 transport protein TqsA
MEAGHLPQRVRRAFGEGQGEQILTVAGNINAAMAGYLRLKAKASFLLAVLVTLVLRACGVQFAIMWGVLTFICNFIPYIGSIVAVSLPIIFAFLMLELGWQPVAAAAGVLTIHLASA